MHDIKFRIWDGAKNEWLASSDKDALPYYGFALVGEVMTVQSPPVWALDEGNVVEQYVGLKDKNDKEIYEGDIVEIAGVEINGQKNRDVVWLKHGVYEPVAYFEESALEVIGNVHENPELIKQGGK